MDLDVKAGEIVGFLGPNGAGKTTTLRMLTTLLAPTSGSATVAGCDLLRDPAGVRERIGYVPQGGTSNGEAKLREELVLQARLYRIAKAEAGRRADALIAELELDGLGDRRTRTLYPALVVSAFAAAVVVAPLTPGALLALLAAPLAHAPVSAVRAGLTGRALVPVLQGTGKLQLAYGVLLATGLALS